MRMLSSDNGLRNQHTLPILIFQYVFQLYTLVFFYYILTNHHHFEDDNPEENLFFAF